MLVLSNYSIYPFGLIFNPVRWKNDLFFPRRAFGRHFRLFQIKIDPFGKDLADPVQPLGHRDIVIHIPPAVDSLTRNPDPVPWGRQNSGFNRL